MIFPTNIAAFMSDLKKSHLKSVSGYVFVAYYGVTCGLDDNLTDIEAAVPGRDTRRLVCQWRGDTVRTYLKSDWYLREKVRNNLPLLGKFYHLK